MTLSNAKTYGNAGVTNFSVEEDGGSLSVLVPFFMSYAFESDRRFQKQTLNPESQKCISKVLAVGQTTHLHFLYKSKAWYETIFYNTFMGCGHWECFSHWEIVGVCVEQYNDGSVCVFNYLLWCFPFWVPRCPLFLKLKHPKGNISTFAFFLYKTEQAVYFENQVMATT